MLNEWIIIIYVNQLGSNIWNLPSGKRLHNYGKSPCYSWENLLFLWACSIAMLVYQRVC